MEKKRIAILGSTGSIGKQAVEVLLENKHLFEAEVLAAYNNADLLIEQAMLLKPNAVVIVNKEHYKKVHQALNPLDIKVYSGEKSLVQIVEMDTIDIVLAAVVGYAGLASTLNAIKHKKTIALANKETLVVAGDLITQQAEENKVLIIPVDSEHSAIFQCLVGEWQNPIEKIYLTASGGPFRGKSASELSEVTVKQALKHPNWSMGAKITIDSATLMNKGLEVIEAKWLFNLEPNQIDVIIHPQSIVHSIAQFNDGSMKAQMGLPDMKLPIQYALAFPQRVKNEFKRFDFLNYPHLSFEKPDLETFLCLTLAYKAMNLGGNAPCILNAANEIAVESFLNEKLKFNEIPRIIEKCLEEIKFIKHPSYDDYTLSDKETRAFAYSLI